MLQLLGEATDQLSIKLGQTLSGLLNASFGNAVEIIIGIAALVNGKVSEFLCPASNCFCQANFESFKHQ